MIILLKFSWNLIFACSAIGAYTQPPEGCKQCNITEEAIEEYVICHLLYDNSCANLRHAMDVGISSHKAGGGIDGGILVGALADALAERGH